EVSVPAGSLLVIRASGIALDVVTTGGLAEAPKGAQSTTNGSDERRFLINEAGGATVRGAFRRDVGWQFTAIPDHAPTIALTKDLTEHPWAGADVAMTLSARDEAGNEGRSEPFEMRLPERPFSKPMGRALVEQRRMLALDADAQAKVLNALDALTLAPETFHMESNVYLGVRAIYWQLAHAKTDDQLREVVARMWDMAVHLEDGSVSDAEQALRAAEEALRQALERGASDEEIKRLTDQLRAALDKFLQALAEQMRKNPQQLARPLDPNARQLRPQDLRNLI